MRSILKEIIATKQNEINKYIAVDEVIIKEIDDLTKDLKKDELYNSLIHGLNHSKKVFLFSYIIGKKMNLNKVDLKIISDAALYHDIGRMNDYEDTIHGYASSIKVDKVVDSDIYKNEENRNLLKAVIDSHSLADDRKEFMIDQYEIKDVERFEILHGILKDADALDRCRFYESSLAYLDERFLRSDIAKELVDFSKMVNNIYKEKLKERIVRNEEKGEATLGCFHSVGFDFFKMISVLKNGILSKGEMDRLNITGTSNFEGGNLNDFISVVDANLIKSGGSAFSEFIMNGISFYCLTDKLHTSNINHTRSYCIENGLPYNVSKHDDERYVYKKIEVENIQSIFVSNKYTNKDIRELPYIYNYISHEVILNRVKHYYRHISKNIVPDFHEMSKLLSDYKDITDEHMMRDPRAKELNNKSTMFKLDAYRKEINSIIQQWMHMNYCTELGRKEGTITVSEVVIHELKKMNYDIVIQNSESGIVINFEKVKDKSFNSGKTR